MAPPTKNRGISHGISFSTTKITLKIPTFLRYGIVEEGILICVIVQTKGTNQRDGSFGLYMPKAYQKNRPFGLLSRHHRLRLKHAEGMSLRYGVICLGIFGVFLRVFFVGRKFALIKIICYFAK